MAGYNHGKYWTATRLKRRGWTNALIRELLSPPRSVRSDGGYVRVWSRGEVKAAENNPRFQREKGESVGPAPPPKRVISALNRAWETAELHDPAPWDHTSPNAPPERLLAARYHNALIARLRGGGGKHGLRSAQAKGYFNEFLSLKQRCDSTRLPEILRNFLSACTWLEEQFHLDAAQQSGDPVQQFGDPTQQSGDPAESSADKFARKIPDEFTRNILVEYPYVIRSAAEQIVGEFSSRHPQTVWQDFLARQDFPLQMLFREGLETVWSVWYVPRAIRSSLSLLLALHPKDEYPEARAMHRHFILHLGETNTGKTYAGFQRLIESPTGVYLAPLRLLALEAQETLLEAGVDCALTTGEEEDWREDDTHVAATAEKLSLTQRYDVAVVDECQMIADSQRGYAWTRAILGVQAPEVHLCAAPEAKNLLIRLIESCDDSYEVEFHQRKTPLICMTRTVDLDHVQPGDALITFSKINVLSVAEDLRQAGKEPAIIYGALPYSTRRKQVQGFLDGQMQYVVATDAIGMGLNLPIRRILFMDTRKFDGVEQRDLTPSEIRQIAGRAGRFGMYDEGYVGATENISAIRAGLNTPVPPLTYAVAGFSDLVLRVDFDLLEVLTEWSKMPAVEPFRKLDISRYLTVISKMREQGFSFTREKELRAANIPFDETEEALRELFFHFLRQYQRGETVEQPGPPEKQDLTLPELELHYRKLDLYFSFAKAFDCPVDADRLYESRERTADAINEILLHRLRNNIRFCARCGQALPLYHHGQLCGSCWRKAHGSGGARIRRRPGAK